MPQVLNSGIPSQPLMASPIDLETTVHAVPWVVAGRMGDELALLDPGTGLYFGLSGVAVDIWPCLQEPAKVRAIVDKILAEYEIDRATCEAQVRQFLGRLHDAKLLVIPNEGRS